MNIDEILAKPKENWTLEESVYVDYVFAYTQNQGAQIQPYQTLPSGRYLHNPAQKTLKSADQMAADLLEGAKNASGKWNRGMHNPKRDPIKAALDNEDKMKHNTMKALQEGKWRKNLSKVTHADIIKVVDKLGEGVYTAGVDARSDKIKAAMTELQPKLQAVSNAIQAMPSGTDADREKRMVENLKLMRKIASGI